MDRMLEPESHRTWAACSSSHQSLGSCRNRPVNSRGDCGCVPLPSIGHQIEYRRRSRPSVFAPHRILRPAVGCPSVLSRCGRLIWWTHRRRRHGAGSTDLYGPTECELAGRRRRSDEGLRFCVMPLHSGACRGRGAAVEDDVTRQALMRCQPPSPAPRMRRLHLRSLPAALLGATCNHGGERPGLGTPVRHCVFRFSQHLIIHKCSLMSSAPWLMLPSVARVSGKRLHGVARCRGPSMLRLGGHRGRNKQRKVLLYLADMSH